VSGDKPDKPPTKQSIYEAISNTNGALAWARSLVKDNHLKEARAYIDGAQVTLLLAKTRIEAREEAGL